MFVTEIRSLNKKKSRILFDDGEDLVLYNGEIRASRIKEQEELPDEVYEKLAGEVLTKRAKHRAMYLLLRQMRTKKELEDKLSRKMAIRRESLKRLSRTWRASLYRRPRIRGSSIQAAVRKRKKAVLYALAHRKAWINAVESRVLQAEDARDSMNLQKCRLSKARHAAPAG